jgi:DNA transposition AAA+ family ATPase
VKGYIIFCGVNQNQNYQESEYEDENLSKTLFSEGIE